MSDELIGKIVAGKYLVEEELRKSGLGTIYRGKHEQMEKGILIKILSPELADDAEQVERFSAEARIVSQISHPNVLNVTDFGRDEDDTVYIVFEDAEGRSLKEEIESEGLFLPERAVRVARQIASALSAAHSKVILHHHLHSGNILLSHTANEAEIVKVLGFGSVKLEDTLEFDEENPPKFIEYLSPEKLTESGEIDERSDIYALGVILYEMLTGDVPYTGETVEDILEKQEQMPPRPLTAFRDDLPDELEPVVLKALAQNPEMRYQTAEEFADDLADIAKEFNEGDSLIVPRGAAAAASAGSRKSNLWKTAFVVLAGVTLLAAGLIYATSIKQTEPQTKLQTDENAIPVQPLNPATGAGERNLTVISDDSIPEYVGNSSVPVPGYDQGGDGYCAWCGNGPPPGAPTYQPGGEVITIPGDSGSQFMPDFEGGYVLIPVPANTNMNPNPTQDANAKPTPAASPSGEQSANVAKPTPAPKETTPQPKETDKPKTPANKKPAETKPKPKSTSPASTSKNIESGKESDTKN